MLKCAKRISQNVLTNVYLTCVLKPKLEFSTIWPHWASFVLMLACFLYQYGRHFPDDILVWSHFLTLEVCLCIQCHRTIRSSYFFNTLRPRQNCRHFSDDIFTYIFLNENVWILIKISLKFVRKGPVNNIPALVQIMAWCRPGDKHYLNQWWLVYWRIYASLASSMS